MELHTKKGLLVILQGKDTVFVAKKSKTVRGALDVVRLAGITEHPSPRQALAMVRKAGVSEADFRKAFGHLLTQKP